MTSKERLLTAIKGGQPDRLPVTTHHVMPYFLKKYYGAKSAAEFYQEMGFDAILWHMPLKADERAEEYYQIPQGAPENHQKLLMSEKWQISARPIENHTYATTRYNIWTPGGNLSMVLQGNEYTSWVSEHLIKNDVDIELIEQYMPVSLCDQADLQSAYENFGEQGIVRAHIPGFELFGQPGCWQDACCLVGTEKMIMQTYDDPEWVHEFLGILQRKKLKYVRSLFGAAYDLLELGGGDASTTVISPGIFNEFVAPYDSALITAAHQAGQRIVYHICGGKMPILEDIAAMKPDAVETFTPVGMGGDVILKEAKQRIGDKCCMIGGFDQGHHLINCTREETREAVRQCFAEAGTGGGYILSPSDHFFDADMTLIKALVDEASQCRY